MLGYVRAYKPEMRMKDYELYKGVYCSLCRALGRNYSPLAQLFLSYDFTLACILRLAAAESGCGFTQKRCPYNLAKKCMICSSREVFDLCAHAVIITVYYKILDNLHDKGFFSKLAAALIFPAVALMHKKAKKLAPEIESAVAGAMQKQAQAEAKSAPSLDEAAHPSAEALAKVFSLGFEGEKADALYTIGYMTGRFVYILDAADDLEDDVKKGGFNPFKNEDITSRNGRKAFADKVRGMLCLTQSEALESFDRLDLQRFYDITENILLEGLSNCAERVLSKYGEKTQKSKEYTVE